MTPLHICEVRNQLGEGVIWDHRTGILRWTDIESSRLWQWDMATGQPSCVALPERLGSFALTEDPLVLLGAFESGFARFAPNSGTFELIAPVTQRSKTLRMNDGRVDRAGHFWAGSMPEGVESRLGSLWRYDGDGKASEHVTDVRIPNSLCWSRDGRTMYFADSPRCTIWAYDFDACLGPIGEPRVFAQTLPGIHPDGSCIDSEDHLWNAQWGAGQIVRYRPDGTIERRVSLPVSQPSCVAFGGYELNLLCVTTARVDLSSIELAQQSSAGALLVYQTDVTGVAEEICTASH